MSDTSEFLLMIRTWWLWIKDKISFENVCIWLILFRNWTVFFFPFFFKLQKMFMLFVISFERKGVFNHSLCHNSQTCTMTTVKNGNVEIELPNGMGMKIGKMTKNKVRNDDTTASRQYPIKRHQKCRKKFNKTERKRRNDDCGKVTSFLSENQLKKAKSNNNKCVANSCIRPNPLSISIHTYATMSNEVNIGDTYR